MMVVVAPRSMVTHIEGCMRLNSWGMERLTLEALGPQYGSLLALIGQGGLAVTRQARCLRRAGRAVVEDLAGIFTGAEASDGCSRGPDEPATIETVEDAEEAGDRVPLQLRGAAKCVVSKRQ